MNWKVVTPYIYHNGKWCKCITCYKYNTDSQIWQPLILKIFC